MIRGGGGWRANVHAMMPGESVISYLYRGNRLALFDHFLVRAVIHNKWNSFGKPRFYREFCGVIIVMTLFSVAETLPHKWWLGDEPGTDVYVQISLEGAAVAAFLFFKLRFEIVEAWQARGWFGYISDATGFSLFDNCATFLFVVCIIAITITRIGCIATSTDDDQHHDAWQIAESSCTGLTLAVGWVGFVVKYLLGFDFTGIFVLMLYQMLVHDVLRFLTIFIFLLVSLGCSFYTLVDVVDSGATSNGEGSYTFIERLKHLLKVAFSGPEWDAYGATPITEILFFLFTILIMVMLMNMLIAQMADTYTRMLENATLLFRKNRAALLFQYEHGISANKFRQCSFKNLVIMNGASYIRVHDNDASYYGRDKPYKVPTRRLEDFLGKSKGNADVARQHAKTITEAGTAKAKPRNIEKAALKVNALVNSILLVPQGASGDMDWGKIFACVDTSGDNVISRAQFSKFVQRCAKAAHTPDIISNSAINDAFDYIDTDGDKYINLIEFEVFFRQDYGISTTLRRYSVPRLRRSSTTSSW